MIEFDTDAVKALPIDTIFKLPLSLYNVLIT